MHFISCPYPHGHLPYEVTWHLNFFLSYLASSRFHSLPPPSCLLCFHLLLISSGRMADWFRLLSLPFLDELAIFLPVPLYLCITTFPFPAKIFFAKSDYDDYEIYIVN